MAVNAGLGAATGAASGGLKGALVGAVGGAAGAAVRSFTGGAVTVGLSYSAENGFGASVGVGYGPANVTVGISEKGGATVDVGFTESGFNAGLSYNSKTGKASGSAGFSSSDSGTGFALSYNEGDGFGASISKSLDNGINGSLSWSEKGGVGGNIGYEVPGDKNKSKDSLANKMQGSGGSLNWSQRDGVSVAVNASGGVNAGNWSQSGGFQANTNFLNDQWKANFISGKAKEDADAQEASRAAQKEAAAHSGADSIAGAGETLLGGRRNDGDASASADPDDQRIAQLKKELSEGILLADGNGSMSDVGGGSGTASAAKELSKKMAELQQLESNKAARSSGAEKPGILGGIGERFSNLINGNGFNTNASIASSKPTKAVIGTGGGKLGAEIVEDSNGKLYQKVNGKSEWVEINPATMNPQRHAEGQALMAQGAANGDLAAYSKGLAMTKGYGWNDNGLNMVGIRVPVDSQNAKHDDFMLAINKGKLEGVYFTSTQPGQKSYNGSAALGGVGEISTGHFPMVMDDRRNGAGSWKNATLATPEIGGIPGARDKNADGVHSAAERTMQAMLGATPITGVFVHQGKNDTVDIRPDSKTKTLIATYNVASVGGTSAACQTPNTSFYYNAKTGKNEIFTTADHNFGTGKHGSFNSVETLIRNNPKFGYSVINSSDYSGGLMNQLNDLKSNAREELMQRELQDYLKKKPKFKDYDVQFNR
ncbi:hypothetical protein LEP1GSC089_1612 [Leptospira interrogans serovar Autumnalis str. LP101]|nr:hypothetical protein LEP1GSC089_1612 [Leptospira interrogans serovar Autumnalis str. LP101]